MSMLRSMVRVAMGLGLGVVATAMGCMAADEDETTGVAQIAITQVPFDGSVGCIAVTATGGTTVTRRTDVWPGASSVLDLKGLPTGTVSFTGNAYAGPCAQVSPMSAPTWVSDPVLATVGKQPVLVTLSMRRNGQATVGVDFDDSSSCRSLGAPCFSGSECCSNVCADNACQAACQGDGAGCITDADCCGGTCMNGICGCPAGLVMCNGACIDIQFDPQNCGACGLFCPMGTACSFGVCMQSFPTCTDGVRNGYETGVDCGGGLCPACSDGQMCSYGGDCQSGVCTFGFCAPPSCADAVRNGLESDVDCGGGACVPCGDWRFCYASSDCQSGQCINNFCQPPVCSDGIRNGTETDVDCGGNCVPCASGKQCLINSHCLSGLCLGGLCL